MQQEVKYDPPQELGNALVNEPVKKCGGSLCNKLLQSPGLTNLQTTNRMTAISASETICTCI